jgi:hypothetical protein
MSLKNFKTVNGIDIDSYTFPVSIVQKVVKANSATTIDTIDASSFIGIDALVTIKQGSKVRTSSIVLQTNGTSVDLTEYGIIEVGGTISGVALSALVVDSNVLLKCTVTDAATNPARVRMIKNTNFAYVPTVPSAPTITNVTSIKNGAQIEFTAPSDNGQSSITSYTVISNPDNIMVDASSSPISVTGLTGGTQYTFKVRATNSVGYGEFSSESNSVEPIIPPVLSGGTLSSDSTYYYRTFTGSSTLGLSGSSIDIEYAVIGGGGAGGYGENNIGSGGGAGGLLTDTDTLSVGSYPIVIGAGAAFAYAGTARNGSSSTFNSLSAIGGGGGGSYGWYSGGDGGSGGGHGGLATSGQGNNGGSISNSSTSVGCGGGGAGAAGYDSYYPYYMSEASSTGFGGAGYNLSAWSTATSTGVNGYYAGGGAGGNNWYGGYEVLGGSGGGGKGGDAWATTSADSGVTNTGSGGGGGMPSVGVGGGNGGSGLVIVRYLKSDV